MLMKVHYVLPGYCGQGSKLTPNMLELKKKKKKAARLLSSPAKNNEKFGHFPAIWPVVKKVNFALTHLDVTGVNEAYVAGLLSLDLANQVVTWFGISPIIHFKLNNKSHGT